MTRVFLALAFAFTAILFALFLLQKQVKSYNFSFGKEKQVFRGFSDAVKDFKESLPSKDRITEDLKSFEQQPSATNTAEFATSTMYSATSTEH